MTRLALVLVLLLSCAHGKPTPPTIDVEMSPQIDMTKSVLLVCAFNPPIYFGLDPTLHCGTPQEFSEFYDRYKSAHSDGGL